MEDARRSPAAPAAQDVADFCGLVFTNVVLATPSGPVHGWLRTEGSRIAALGPGVPARTDPALREIDGGGGTLLPGFIDVHVHGAVGHEVIDGSGDGLSVIARFLATRGVTSFLPTTWTVGHDTALSSLATIRASMERERDPRAARVLGAHMEGPYLSPEQPGAQDPRFIRPADPVEVDDYLATGAVRMMTLAPEIAENHWLIDECVNRGITVSAGHTDASYADMVAATARGVSQVTHTYSAMTPLHHREPGVVGAAMSLPSLRCELIADNLHVHPVAMALLARLRGPDLVLVSDAVRPTGLPDGEYKIISGRSSRLVDGAVRVAGGALAGSVLTLDTALRNLAAATGRQPAHLWRACSGNAAISAGVATTKGALVPGLDADLVLVDTGIEVELTVVEGQIAYAASEHGQARGEQLT